MFTDETILGRVLHAMQTDDEDPSKQSRKLRALYEEADEAGKKLLDDALICLCGWSLATLIQRTDDGEEEEEETTPYEINWDAPYFDA